MTLPWRRARTGICAAIVAGVFGTGCGDSCIIITNGAATTEWTVTFALNDGVRTGALEAVIFSNDCNGSCDCNPHCDCNANWSGDGAKLDCEAVVDAEVSGSRDGPHEARVRLVSAEEMEGPLEILRCGYRSAVEPVPSDFRVSVTDAPDDASVRSADPPLVVVSRISAR
jgi:hypothetical protein